MASSTALVPYSNGTNVEEEENYGEDEESQMSSLSSLPSKEQTLPNQDSEHAGQSGKVMTKTNGVDEACQLVRAILDQVTLNDSPPVNDELPPPSPASVPKRKRLSPRFGTSQASVATKSTGGSSYTRPHYDNIPHGMLRVSRQQHVWQQFEDSRSMNSSGRKSERGFYGSVDPVSETDGQSFEASSTLSSVDMGNDVGALWMARYKKSQSCSEMKMGNVALATLCSRTLHSLSIDDSVTDEQEDLDDTKENTMEEANEVVSSKESTTSKKSSEKSQPPKSKPKKGWFARRLRRKKHDSKSGPKEVENVRGGSAVGKGSLKVGEKPDPIKMTSEELGDEPLRDMENLPPTPVRNNIKRVSENKFFDENTDWVLSSRSKEDDEESLDAIEMMRSADSEDANELAEDGDLELAPSDSQDGYPTVTPSTDMEDIEEETEADIAEEETEKDMSTAPEILRDLKETEAKQLVLSPKVLQVKTSRLQPSKPPVTRTNGRIQMYGSEYARFLSSTPFSPQIPRGRSKQIGSSSATALTSSLICKPGARSGVSSKTRSVNVEDADNAILTGAITDIVVTHGNELPPKGYFRISQTGSGEEFAALRRLTPGTPKGRKTVPVFLNVKKEPSWDKAAQRPCVTALALIFPDRKEFVPPGFCVVRRYKGGVGPESLSLKESTSPANLNHGSSGERVYLCYRRSREGNPITGIIPLLPSKGEPIPEGYTVLERTPRNFVADMNSKAGFPVFLAFRQRLANLETLRPLPLVLSIHYSNSPSPEGTEEQTPVHPSPEKKQLLTYYCTGGTVVPSKVGRFHIMDRSTHSLLSPSSVSNRISLIEASRKQHSSVDCADIPKSSSSTTYTSSAGPPFFPGPGSQGHILSTPSTSVSEVGLQGDGSISNNSSTFVRRMTGIEANSAGRPRSHSRDHSFSSLSELTLNDGPGNGHGGSHADSANASHPSLTSRQSSALKTCLDAMDFIPVIEDADILSEAAEVHNDNEILQSRIAVLTPILTACYTHHGGSAIVAVEGLYKLLTTTDFFEKDVTESLDAENGATSRLTLLDLAIQAVCDVATASSRETSFSPCVEFVDNAIRYSGGKLNTRTIGYAIRFYLFVFYFGASVPAASSSWPLARRFDPDTGLLSFVTHDVPLLLEEGGTVEFGKPRPFLNGGAPQAAALSLKELVSLSLIRLRNVSSIESKELPRIANGDGTETVEGFVQTILSSLVDEAVQHVDLANYTQLALHQMHRSGGSELFWHDMISACGHGLFGDNESFGKESQKVFIMSFAIMANLVKVSSTKIRRMTRTEESVPRDVASKLLSMELLSHFLESWGQEQSIVHENESTIKSVQSMNTMAYAIRRLVVPCLLWNTESGLENARVFRRVIRIISALWSTPFYRRTLKMELGVLIEHFILRVLELGEHLLPAQQTFESSNVVGISNTLTSQQSQSLLSHQREILTELKDWFRPGQDDMVEIFLNFDLDFSPGGNGSTTRVMPGPQWKITQQLCAGLCAIAEKSGEVIGEQIRVSQTTGVGPPSPKAMTPEKGIAMASAREGGRLLQHKAFDVLTSIAKSLAESAAGASGKRYRRLVTSWSLKGGEVALLECDSDLSEDEESTASAGKFSIPSPRSRLWKNGTKRMNLLISSPKECLSPRSRSYSPRKRSEIVDYWQNSIAPERRKAMLSSPRGRSVSPSRRTHTPEASRDHRVPSTAPVKLTKDGEKPASDENSEATKSSQSETQNTEETLDVAFDLVKNKGLKNAIDYLIASNFLTPSPRDIASFLRIHNSRMDSEVLGNYLGDGGKDGADIEYRNLIRFNYVRAISFVGMNVEEGLRYFLTNCGFRLPGEAQKIDRIMTTFSQCYWEDNAGDMQRCPFQDQDTVFLLSFAIIMLNTDLHKVRLPNASRMQRKKMTKAEFLNNLRGVDSSEELTRDYLSAIYDSIEANPIAIIEDMNGGSFPTTPVNNKNGDGKESDDDDLVSQFNAIIHSVKPAEELLRGLSVHENPFYTVADYCNGTDGKTQHAMRNLVRKALSTTWYLFHGVINATLEKAHLDSQGLEFCLDVLKYSICATICMDMTMERSAFVTQLARFKLFTEKRDQWFGARNLNAYKLEDWYIDLEMDCSDPLDEKAKLSALEQVHKIFEDLHSNLKIDTGIAKDMHRAVRHIRNGGFLLNDPSRSFIREGNLMKRANRSGRNIPYRFFLFSDVLIYAKKSSTSTDNDYKVHEELPLHFMKVTDYFPSSGGKQKYLRRSFEIHHPRKSFLVVADTLEEKREWVLALRASIEKEIQRKARLESARLTSSLHQWGG